MPAYEGCGGAFSLLEIALPLHAFLDYAYTPEFTPTNLAGFQAGSLPIAKWPLFYFSTSLKWGSSQKAFKINVNNPQ